MIERYEINGWTVRSAETKEDMSILEKEFSDEFKTKYDTPQKRWDYLMELRYEVIMSKYGYIPRLDRFNPIVTSR
jgi:hypothetical protein